MAKRQWAYRPSDEEHELLLHFMAEHPEYISIAQLIREAVLRLCHEDNTPKLFSELEDLIEELGEAKTKFISLVLKNSVE